MRKFTRNIMLFLCLTILIISLLQAIISYRIKGKTVTGYDNWDTTTNLNANLILMGSSRCWVQLDPRFFNKYYHLKTVNIGMNGHSEITAFKLRLKNYLSKNKPPKFAVLCFDPFISVGNIKKNTNFTNKNNYARFAFLPLKNNIEMVNYFKFNSYEKYIPLYAVFKYQLFEDAILMNKSKLFSEGFELNDEKWDTIKYPISDFIKKYYFKQRDIPNILIALKEFDDLCKANKIQLICIQTPVYKSAYDAKYFEMPKLICQKLNIPFIDANYESIRNKTANFYNTNHLNKNGVIELNKLLKYEKELDNFFKINP